MLLTTTMTNPFYPTHQPRDAYALDSALVEWRHKLDARGVFQEYRAYSRCYARHACVLLDYGVTLAPDVYHVPEVRTLSKRR